jgi:hypothetical protein
MKSDTKEVRNGIKFTVPVPENATEFDTLAGEVGAHMSEANDNIWYRGVLPDCWFWLATALNVQHIKTHPELARKMKAHPDGKKHTEGEKKGQVIMVSGESDPQYVDRVAAELKVQPTSFQSLADEICNMVGPKTKVFGTDTNLADGERLISFDPKARARGSGPAIAKGDIEVAKQLIALGPKGFGVALKNLEKELGRKIEVPAKDHPNHDAELVKAVAIGFRDFRTSESAKLAAKLKG